MRSRSSSAHGGGAVGALSSAIEYAAGTRVESVELTPREGGGDAGGSSAGESGGDGAPPVVGRIHTHAGDVVVGSMTVDFEAIAEAEQEMAHARSIRESAGLDASRSTPTSPAHSVSSAASGSAAAAAAAVAATSVSTAPAFGVPSHLPPAVVASLARHASASAAAGPPPAPYDTATAADAPAPTMALLLFPVDDWARRTPAASPRSSAPRHYVS